MARFLVFLLACALLAAAAEYSKSRKSMFRDGVGSFEVATYSREKAIILPQITRSSGGAFKSVKAPSVEDAQPNWQARATAMWGKIKSLLNG